MKKAALPILAILAILVAAPLAHADNRVTALAVAAGGKSIVVAHADHSLRQLALPDGRELHKLSFDEVPLCIALAPDGKRLAVGGFGLLDVFDLASGTKLASVKEPLGHGSINGLAFSPDGKRLAAAGDFGRAAILDPATGKLVRELSGLKKIVNDIAFSPDGKEVATVGVDENVTLWGAEEGVQLWDLAAHKAGDKLPAARSQVTAIAYVTNGQLLVGDWNGDVHLYDVAAKTHTTLAK